MNFNLKDQLYNCLFGIKNIIDNVFHIKRHFIKLLQQLEEQSLKVCQSGESPKADSGMKSLQT